LRRRRSGWLSEPAFRTLALEQLSPLARGLAAKALCGNTLDPLGLGAFEGVQSAANRLTVDAELVGEVDHAFACANPRTDPLDLVIGQFGIRWHTISVSSWDISRDIRDVGLIRTGSCATPAEKPKLKR
jgi:hypothetical protein